MAKKETTRKTKAQPKASPRKKAIQAKWNEFLSAVKPDAVKAGMTALEFVEKLVTDNLQSTFRKNKAALQRRMQGDKARGRKRP